jgi:hypothetical protein
MCSQRGVLLPRRANVFLWHLSTFGFVRESRIPHLFQRFPTGKAMRVLGESEANYFFDANLCDLTMCCRSRYTKLVHAGPSPRVNLTWETGNKNSFTALEGPDRPAHHRLRPVGRLQRTRVGTGCHRALYTASLRAVHRNLGHLANGGTR